MTQAPHGGQAAPLTTNYGSGGSRRSSNTANGTPDQANGARDAANGNPSPGTQTASAPWNAAPMGQGAPGEAPAGYSGYGNQTYADAPTASVPLVQGTAAPTQAGRGAAPQPPTPPAGQSGRGSGRGARARGPRRARLQLRHVNPWTVLKFSCVLSIALFFVWLIVVGVLYGVLDGAGIIHKINDSYTTIQGGDSKAPVTAGVVFGGAAIIGVVNIVLFVALSTVGSVVYNLCADLVGGIEVTLSER
jgi:hypothetical protein